MSNLLSNYTLNELLKYGNIPDDTLLMLEKLIPDEYELEIKEKQLNNRIEILEEQLYFASELITSILNLTKNEYRYKETKKLCKDISLLQQSSFFEL